jgi:mannose-6-phosphate isomerase-like protein (cupin superfamily)
MDAHDLTDSIVQLDRSGQLYHEFLRVPMMSAGVYRLCAGSIDPQSPHTEDELYYIISGRASIRVGAEDRSVTAGSSVFVAANVEHRFHSIEEDMIIFVFFAPAEYSNKGAPASAGKDAD